MKRKIPQCPTGLKKHGRKFWRSTCVSFELEPAELAVLEGCCVNLDAFHATKIFLDENGFLYDTPRGSKQRPECAVMRDSWRAYLSGVKILGITSKPETGKQAGHPVGDARQLKAVKTW